MDQLALFSEAAAPLITVAYDGPEKFYTGALQRDGAELYIHLIRADDDPERGPRDGQTLRWRRIDDHPPRSWRDRIVDLLQDGVPRTFNRIMLELSDFTADVGFKTNADKGLWLACSEYRLGFTLEAPILFVAIRELPDVDAASDAPLAARNND